MQLDLGKSRDVEASPDMLALLREHTKPSHERLDSAFGSLALDRREGLVRFLAAHTIGMTPLHETFRHFVSEELNMPAPDYLTMLHKDLAALGVDPMALPSLDMPPEAATGIGYVISGARLGRSVIRRQGYWGERQGFRSLYMEDDSGPACWKALLPWLRQRNFNRAEEEAVSDAALASFDTFARAFAVSPAEDSLKEMGADG